MTKKFGKHLQPTYEQLFRPYRVASAVRTMISNTGDRTRNNRIQKMKLY